MTRSTRANQLTQPFKFLNIKYFRKKLIKNIKIIQNIAEFYVIVNYLKQIRFG